jgi:hypothetical protein
MLVQLRAINAVLLAVIHDAASSVRPNIAGSLTDTEGITALACDELLIHSWDIGRGLEEPFAAPEDLADEVIRRLFPWAPAGENRWDVFLWCNGRSALGQRERLGPDWPRWFPPLEEWDGTDLTAKRGAPSG